MTPPPWANGLFTRLQRVRETKAGCEWVAMCPAHDDHDPSLSITFRNGRLLLCCFSNGCHQDAILRAIGLDWKVLVPPQAPDYTQPARNGKQPQRRIVATYPYTDETGKLLYEVVRYDPKGFNQRVPTDKPGVYLYRLQGVRRVLYHEREVRAAITQHQPVMLVEGEKDADNLRALGLVATTCAQGAANWRPEYSETLRGADVVILPDNDTAGAKDRDAKGAALAGVVSRLRVLALPGLPEKGDVSDWLSNGGTASELLRLVAGAPPWTPPAPPDQAPATHGEPRKMTDLGNAERLIDLHGNDLRYCWAWSQWLVWNGHHWQPDETGEIHRRAKATVRNIPMEASRCEDDNLRPALLKHAIGSEKMARVGAMIDLARSEVGIPVLPANLDAFPFLLNCQNGTIDLQHGNLRPHRRQDLLTKILPISFDPKATCPIWDAFLLRILPDADVRAFVQRAAGYSLTGDVREQAFFFLFGSGRNGKSTFIATLEALVGDYACRTRADVLMQDRHGPNKGATPDLVKLQGRRLVTVTELQDGQRLDEALIKDLTGGDTISARDVYKSGVEFRPTHKLWLAGNHKPTISGTDEGIWRRPKLIPFTETISEQEKDEELPEKLLQELPGILAWAVRGCLEWQRVGLQTPVIVTAAAQEYRNEQDHLATFIEDCCVLSPTAHVSRGALWEVYDAWKKRTGETGLKDASRLTREIKRRDGIQEGKIRGIRLWYGIGLRADLPEGGSKEGQGGSKEGVSENFSQRFPFVSDLSGNTAPPAPPAPPDDELNEPDPFADESEEP